MLDFELKYGKYQRAHKLNKIDIFLKQHREFDIALAENVVNVSREIYILVSYL